MYRWLEGEPATADDDRRSGRRSRSTLAGFLRALRRRGCRPAGRRPGRTTSTAAGRFATYEAETLRAIEALGDRIAARRGALASGTPRSRAWDGDPVWFHGDVAEGNLLLRDGRLAAVIDFGTCGVGDPACDMVIAWTLLAAGAGRRSARRSAATRGVGARARLGAVEGADHVRVPASRATLAEVLADDGNGNGAG